MKKFHRIIDTQQRFIALFDPTTGAYVRTGILDEQGRDTGIDPFMASFPHLIDVGIMGHCEHGRSGLCMKAGVGCYQDGLRKVEDHMSVEDFRSIAVQCNGKVNQFAIGGRGDPDQHPEFEEILRTCRENNIVPNYTTSGYGLTEELAAISKKYCGAVAVSWYRNEYTTRAIDLLVKHGVTTNIHFVLAKNTIDEAIERMKKSDFPIGINSVVFLLHKPVGLGSRKNVLSASDPRVKEFYALLDRGETTFKVGMDSCSMPGVVNFCHSIMHETIEPCEAARFSCYISPSLLMTPCSFDQEMRHGVDLRQMTVEQAWNSEKFTQFRQHAKQSCGSCKLRTDCMGGCPITSEIVLCERDEKELWVLNGGKENVML